MRRRGDEGLRGERGTARVQRVRTIERAPAVRGMGVHRGSREGAYVGEREEYCACVGEAKGAKRVEG